MKIELLSINIHEDVPYCDDVFDYGIALLAIANGPALLRFEVTFHPYLGRSLRWDVAGVGWLWGKVSAEIYHWRRKRRWELDREDEFNVPF